MILPCRPVRRGPAASRDQIPERAQTPGALTHNGPRPFGAHTSKPMSSPRCLRPPRQLNRIGAALSKRDINSLLESILIAAMNLTRRRWHPLPR